jgi:hypothetical protein
MPSDTRPVGDAERRRGADRRRSLFHSLWDGNFLRRRRSLRRHTDSGRTILDWHSPRWLAVAILILLLCVADAVLTLALLGRGAYEANPAIAPFLERGTLDFAVAKIGMTALGVVVLTLLAQAKAFKRRIAVSTVLYTIVAGYVVLIGYELWLLQKLSDA